MIQQSKASSKQLHKAMNAPDTDNTQAAAIIGNPRRIAVLRALQLGDMLLAVPALRALRRQFPDAEITLIGLPWAASFAQRFNRYIDRFVEFGGYPGIAEVPVEPERVQQFLEEQRAYNYDLVIQMHGSGQTSNACAHALGGHVTAAYYPTPRRGRLTVPTAGLPASPRIHTMPTADVSAPYPENAHEIERNLGLARLLGCREQDTALEFPLFKDDYVEAAQLLYNLPRADRPWIGIHAGARPTARRWPATYFAQVADELARRYNAQVILTGGPGEEATVQLVAQHMTMSALNLAGKTSLGGLAALIGELDLFISNDTGPAHVANAVDTPSITLFGPVDPRRWAALNQARHPFLRHPVACSPCGYVECPIDHRCLRWLKPETVLETVGTLLTRGTVVCNA